MKSYQTFMCFLHIRFSPLFELLFLIAYLISPGYTFGLCALFIADTNPREPCVFRSLEVGNTFLILSYSKTKGQKCLSCGAISHSDYAFFRCPLKFSQVLAGYTLCSMFFSPCLTCPGEFKVSLLFLKCLA